MAVVVAVGVAVAVAVGAGGVGVGVGAGLVAVPEGVGVTFGGRGVPVEVGAGLAVDDEVALGDGAGVAGADVAVEVAVDVADGTGVGSGTGAVFGGAGVGFLVAGGALVVGLVLPDGAGLGAAFFGGAGETFLSVSGGVSVGLVFPEGVGSDVLGGPSVDLVFTGGFSVGRDFLDGGSDGTAFLGWTVSLVCGSRAGAENCSAGTSSVRGALFLSPGRLWDVGGESPVLGGDVRSTGARSVFVSVDGSPSGPEGEPLSAGGFSSGAERESPSVDGFSSGVERESPSEGGPSSGGEGFSASGGNSCCAGGGPAGGPANSCDDEPELTPGSATAAHGWAMTALVVADTAASRRPESKVTRRDELRGGIDRSSWIYGVGSGPEMGFQPAAVNSGVPGRATCGTEVARGSGTLTQSPWFAPRMPGCQTMSRLMAYGLE
ncbi:hypothetical protein OG339_44540 [Streptosporangium sp. NBC_01495]|uniref:hypothetical protein n=1 Tax=Streptosporangium sp. NBC_01495 TaxID=2903899 RepID=UPI002E33A4D7|nr:hypothetical protein [Streptosporangium sp. NBC_01495]